jgi:predicted anti-sigma-YlaC factor YlaD
MEAMTEPTEMECRQIAELLGDYLEGTVAKETRELIEWHIESCAPCVAFVNTYRGTINAARKLQETPIPPELKHRLLNVLRARQASP